MKFRPLHDRVVVRRIDAEEKTAGGIIIPDTAKEKPQQGEVLAVGPGKRDETGKLLPLDVKAGDQILFGKWSGTEVKVDGAQGRGDRRCRGIGSARCRPFRFLKDLTAQRRTSGI
jgi:chaperonin GroES